MTLENGFSIAIRPSGTEPKIKYYLFGCGDRNPSNLDESKKLIREKVESIASWLVKDANNRVEETK
jgi:phosphoglucomutase